MVWKAKAATKPPATRCYQCGSPSFGCLICTACYDAPRPFSDVLREPDRPRQGADRRRKGGPHGKD